MCSAKGPNISKRATGNTFSASAGFYQLRAAELKHGRVVTGTQKKRQVFFESLDHTNVIPEARLVKIHYIPFLNYNIASENRPYQKEIHLSTIHFHGLC